MQKQVAHIEERVKAQGPGWQMDVTETEEEVIVRNVNSRRSSGRGHQRKQGWRFHEARWRRFPQALKAPSILIQAEVIRHDLFVLALEQHPFHQGTNNRVIVAHVVGVVQLDHVPRLRPVIGK